MKRTIIIFILSVLIGLEIFSIIGSATLGIVKQNECIDIKTTLNSSWANISIHAPRNLTTLVSNQAWTKVGKTFNYTFCDTKILGKYVYDYYNDAGDVYENDFLVTETGEQVSLSNIITPIILIVLSILVLYIGTTFNAEKWLLKSGLFVFALLFGVLALNSARIIASESSNLSSMSFTGLIIGISLVSLFVVYLFVLYFVDIIHIARQKKELRWKQ